MFLGAGPMRPLPGYTSNVACISGASTSSSGVSMYISSGSGDPSGMRVDGLRKSSKNAWPQASIALHRVSGT